MFELEPEERWAGLADEEARLELSPSALERIVDRVASRGIDSATPARGPLLRSRAMNVHVGYRGGGQEPVPADRIDDALRRLVAQMLTEEFDTPDDEHAQAYVRRSDDESLTAYVDGLLVFESAADKRYAVAQTGAEMQERLRRFVSGEAPTEAVGWVASAREAGELPGRDFRPYPYVPLEAAVRDEALQAVLESIAQDALFRRVEEVSPETPFLEDPDDAEEREALVECLQEMAAELDYFHMSGLDFVTEPIPLQNPGSIATVGDALAQFERGLTTLAARARSRAEREEHAAREPKVVPENAAVLRDVHAVLAEQTGREVANISPESKLVDDLQQDQLDLECVLMALEETFGLELDYQRMTNYQEDLTLLGPIPGFTVTELANWVWEQIAAAAAADEEPPGR